MTLEQIKNNARRYGACNAIDSVQTYDALVDLMFSPIGREFCVHAEFPNLHTLRNIAPYLGERFFVDSGHITLKPSADVAIGGDTTATVCYDTPDKLYHLVLHQGATAHIVLSGYAVLTLTLVGACNYTIDCAPTASISIEKKTVENPYKLCKEY